MERGWPNDDGIDTNDAEGGPSLTVDEFLRQGGGTGEAGWQFVVGEPDDIGIGQDIGSGGGDGDG